MPVRFRPTVPEHFRPIITLHPSPTQTTQVDLFQLAASVRPPQLRLDLVGGVSLFLGLVSLTLAIRLLASWRLAKRLRNRSLEASDRIRSMTDKSVRVVEGLLSPAAFGGLEPIILLPAEAEEWPEDQLRAILIHESAHLDNSDPTWQLLAEIVCSLHWFNPLAWYVRNAMRTSAERAADDSVIRAGILPSAYASDLAAFAGRIGKSRQPVVWTTFARRESIKDRIQAILSQSNQRKPMTLASKIASVVGFSMAAYITSAYVRQGETNSHSPYKDIRAGKTIAARASNNYIGQLSDHRNVEIVQISRQMPNGSIVAWKPDGTLLSPSEAMPLKYHKLDVLDTHTRYLVFRFPEGKGTLTSVNAGCGSGPTFAGEPKEMVFAGGGNITHKDGYFYTVSYIGIPKEDAEKFAVSLSISDSKLKNDWKIDGQNPMIKEFSMKEVSQPNPKDAGFQDWWKAHPGGVTELTFIMPMKDTFDVDYKILPVLKSRKTLEEKDELGNFGGYIQRPPTNQIEGFRFRYYYGCKPSEIESFLFQSRETFNCEALELAANPKKGP